jgi:Alpha-kinase family
MNLNHDHSHISPSDATVPFSASQVAQAFSHFSYWYTNGQCLVCDLQGIFNVERNTLQLSDPVIHSNNNVHGSHANRNPRQDAFHHGYAGNRDHLHSHHFLFDHILPTTRHGRTDRGQKGIDDFFQTHQCEEQDHLCQLVTNSKNILIGR